MAFKHEAPSSAARIGGKIVEGVGISVAAELAIKILERVVKSSL